MGRRTFWSFIKDTIANLGFKLFLWGNDTTEEDYWEVIYQQEKEWRQNNHMKL